MNTHYEKFLKLKSESGLHSPSVFELKNNLKIPISVDSCFLCNPYAFDLFMDYLRVREIDDYVKYYPPQNKILSKILSKNIDINPDYLIIGNGAIQMIELIMREFENKRKCIITPTFSTYYEIDQENIFFFRTTKEENFIVDVDKLIKFCVDKEIEVLVIVNPNNPTGTVITKNNLKKISKHLPKTSVVVDESFIDFYDLNQSMEKEVYNNRNLIVIRSLSKDFGIAGLRLGYAVCDSKMSEKLFSKYGLCWNINGFAQIFLETMGLPEFQTKYKLARERYLEGRKKFYENLTKLKSMKVYDSFANFFIIDCGKNINEVFSFLLFEEQIYTRILNDKLHLEDTFLRVACGTDDDNEKVFESLKKIDNIL